MAGRLSARKVQTAKPGKYSDGGNLYLIISGNGSRKWVLRFTWRGKAKAMGLCSGENPARWRGNLDHLLPRRSNLARGHHAAMPYEDVAAFIAKLREQKGPSTRALELCILTAARSGEILGMRWSEIDF